MLNIDKDKEIKEVVLKAASAINATVVIGLGSKVKGKVIAKIIGKVIAVNSEEVILKHNGGELHDLFYCNMLSIKIKFNQ